MKLTIEDGAFWVLGATYLLVVAYCIRHYVRVYTSKNAASKQQPKKTWAPFFYPMLMVGCSIRGGYMLVHASSLYEHPNVIILLNTSPTLILFSAYMIVLLSWAQLYHSAERANLLRVVYFITNAVFYVGYLIIYFLGVYHKENIVNPGNRFHEALWYMCGFMYFMCSMTFLVYALLLVKFLRVALFATKFDTIKQINYFTFLVVFVSLLRCVFVMLEAFGKLPYDGIWWFIEPVYFAMLEVLPLVIMIQIFQMHKNKTSPGPTSYSPLLPKPIIVTSPPSPVITTSPAPPGSPFLMSTTPRPPQSYYI